MRFHHVLKIGIAFTLLLPLIVFPSHLYPYHFGKVIIFRMMIEVLVVGYIFFILKRPEYRPAFGKIETALILFLALSLVSSLTGLDFTRSFWGTIERMGGWLHFFHLIVFFFLIRALFRSVDEWQMLLSFGVGGAFLSAFFSLMTRWKQVPEDVVSSTAVLLTRAEGTIGNAGPFATYMIMGIFLSCILMAMTQTKWWRTVLAGGAIVMFLVLLLSGTRSAYLAISVSLLLFALLALSTSLPGYFKKSLFAVLLLMVVFVVSIFSARDHLWVRNNNVFSRLSSISLSATTVSTRLWLWKSAWQAWKVKPLLGWGPEHIESALNQYYNPSHFVNEASETWFDRSHNLWLDVAVSVGLIGFSSFIAIFVLMIAQLIHLYRYDSRTRLPAALGLGLICAYIIQQSFWFEDFSSSLLLFLTFALITWWNERVVQTHINPSRNTVTRFQSFFLKLLKMSAKPLAILGGIFLFGSNIIAWQAQLSLTRVSSDFAGGKDNAFASYRQALTRSTPLDRHDLYQRFFEYVILSYSTQQPRTSDEKKLFRENMNFTLSELIRASEEYSYNAKIFFLLATFARQHGDILSSRDSLELAKTAVQRGLELSPNRQMFLFERGLIHLLENEYNHGITILKKAVQLNQALALAHWYLGLAYGHDGQYMLAKQSVEQAISLGYNYQKVAHLLNLVPIYIGVNDLAKVGQLYTDAVRMEPNNPNIYLSSAMLYKRLGDILMARKMIDTAIAIDPTVRDQAQLILQP